MPLLHETPTPEYKYPPKKNMAKLNLVQKLLDKTWIFKTFMSGAFKWGVAWLCSIIFYFYCYGGSLEVCQMRSFIFCQSLWNSTSFESYPSSEHVPSVVFYIKPKRATQILFCLPSPLSSQTLHVKTRKMKIRKEIRYCKIYLK